MKKILVLFFVFCLVVLNGCELLYKLGLKEKEEDNKVTKVEIVMLDDTGTISASEEYILTIYDENNSEDFRYSQYSTARSVTFENVDTGDYVAHCGSPYTIWRKCSAYFC